MAGQPATRATVTPAICTYLASAIASVSGPTAQRRGCATLMCTDDALPRVTRKCSPAPSAQTRSTTTSVAPSCRGTAPQMWRRAGRPVRWAHWDTRRPGPAAVTAVSSSEIAAITPSARLWSDNASAAAQTVTRSSATVIAQVMSLLDHRANEPAVSLAVLQRPGATAIPHSAPNMPSLITTATMSTSGVSAGVETTTPTTLTEMPAPNAPATAPTSIRRPVIPSARNMSPKRRARGRPRYTARTGRTARADGDAPRRRDQRLTTQLGSPGSFTSSRRVTSSS
jgi:hypothetical protein